METKTCVLILRVGRKVFCFVFLHKLEPPASKTFIRAWWHPGLHTRHQRTPWWCQVSVDNIVPNSSRWAPTVTGVIEENLRVGLAEAKTTKRKASLSVSELKNHLQNDINCNTLAILSKPKQEACPPIRADRTKVKAVMELIERKKQKILDVWRSQHRMPLSPFLLEWLHSMSSHGDKRKHMGACCNPRQWLHFCENMSMAAEEETFEPHVAGAFGCSRSSK